VKLHEFNWHRFWAIVCKEFIQMRRDRLTFGMMVGIPLLQLVLFGYAINSDPKHLPTAVYSADNSVFSRTLVWGLRNSSYFDVVREPKNEADIQKMLAQGTVQFAVDIPVDFSRKLLRGEKPELLLEADATDPSAIGYAVGAVNQLATTVLNRDLTGSLADLQGAPPPFNLVVHQHYNPENITQYNIVPGLMGVMLTMTMIIITALAITRERERGTMENLLSTPARPGEVMIGKIVPYITVGYVLCCWCWRFCLSSQTSPSASRSPPSPKTSCRRCKWRSFFSCPRCCCPATCFRFAGCPVGRRMLENSCRSRISCASCAGFC